MEMWRGRKKKKKQTPKVKVKPKNDRIFFKKKRKVTFRLSVQMVFCHKRGRCHAHCVRPAVGLTVSLESLHYHVIISMACSRPGVLV